MGGLTKFKEDFNALDNDMDVKKMTFRNVVTGEFYKWMLRNNLKKIDIAEKLGKSKAAVTSLLSGDRNLTLDKLVELSDVIGCKPYFCLIDKNMNIRSPYIVTAFQWEHTEKTTVDIANLEVSYEESSKFSYYSISNHMEKEND